MKEAINPDAIEAQLSHADNNAVRAAYNRAQYWDERVIMMQDWADYLDELRVGACKGYPTDKTSLINVPVTLFVK